MVAGSFDSLDIAVLALIAEEPRSGVREYARRLNVARATVQSRVDKLQRSGVLVSWRPELELAAIGYPILAYVRLNLVQGKLEDTIKGLAEIPEVLEADSVAGQSDLLCRVVAPDNAGLEEVIQRVLALGGVERTVTEVVLSHRLRRDVLPLIKKLQVRLGA